MSNNLEAILLAGGSGTRLMPFTSYISKHLLPINDVPMIFYPLKNLQLIGVKDVYLIINKEHYEQWHALISIYDFKMKIKIVIQDAPKGIPHAIKCCEKYIKNDQFLVSLGDNVIISSMFLNKFRKEMINKNNSLICGFHVSDPTSFGVAAFDKSQNLIEVIEKPNNPPSNIAIAGLYKFPKNVFLEIEKLKFSDRGELEISDLINKYIKSYSCDFLSNNSHSDFWIDTGTSDAIIRATNFIRDLENNTGNKYAQFDLIDDN